MNKYKSVITSLIMKKAHNLTKAMVEESRKTYHFARIEHLLSFLERNVEYKEGKKENGFFTAITSLDYRSQLSINIKHYLEVEKQSWERNQENKLLRNKALKWIEQYIKHGKNIHSEEMKMILNKMNYDLMINKFYWGKSYNKWHLANSLVCHHRRNVKMWA